MKILSNIKKDLGHISALIRKEFMTIATSYSILLVLIGGIFIYGILYNYMYEPNLVRKVPVAVIDKSKSSLSREYIRLLGATPQVKIYSYAQDMQEAKEMMKKDEVAGIIYIPYDFETRIGRGDQSLFISYANTSAFLEYSTIAESSVNAMLELDDRHRPEMVVFVPLPTLYAISLVQPVQVVGTPLYNYTEGYGSYLIPAVLIIIIFQTLMMVIGMISGNERHSKSILAYVRNEIKFIDMAYVVISKTFVYCVLYTIFAFFLIGLLPHLFSIPNIGNSWNIVFLMIPFLLATCFFGLTASLFFTDSESPPLMIAFFSVGLVFLSGISYPLELMPWYWQAVHYIIPAPPATLAFIKVNSMGASIAQIKTEYITLWLQVAFYFITACLAYSYNIKKELKSSLN